MSDFLHRTTLEYVRSGNDPMFSDPSWLLVLRGSPSEALLLTVPRQYLVLEGDVLREMTQPEKDAVDAAALTAQRASLAASLDNVEDILRAFMLVVLDELNAHADRHNAITAAVDDASNLSQFAAAMRAIPDYPQRTAQQLRNAIRDRLGS